MPQADIPIIGKPTPALLAIRLRDVAKLPSFGHQSETTQLGTTRISSRMRGHSLASTRRRRVSITVLSTRSLPKAFRAWTSKPLSRSLKPVSFRADLQKVSSWRPSSPSAYSRLGPSDK